jgi:acyl carrier protein
MDAALLPLASQIITGLNLEGTKPEDIDPDAPLFGAGLGLDSIDALELAVIIDRTYGIKIQGMEQGKAAFASLRALDAFIRSKRPTA